MRKIFYWPLFLIALFFVFASKILADTTPSPSSSPTPSPTSSPSPIVKINSTDPTDNIVKGASFKVSFSVENVNPLMDYYAKFGLDKGTEWKGKTFNNNGWFSFTGGGSSWDKFPKFTSDNVGKFSGTLEVMTSDSTEEGVNNINIRVAKTDKISEHFDSVDSDPQQINILSPSPTSSLTPTVSPTPTSSPTISPTASAKPSATPKTTPKIQTNKKDEEDEETDFSGEVLGATESSQAGKTEEQPKDDKKEGKKISALPLIIIGSGILFLLAGSFPFIKNFIKKRLTKSQIKNDIL